MHMKSLFWLASVQAGHIMALFYFPSFVNYTETLTGILLGACVVKSVKELKATCVFCLSNLQSYCGAFFMLLTNELAVFRECEKEVFCKGVYRPNFWGFKIKFLFFWVFL